RKTRTFSLNYLCDFIVVPSSAMMAHLMAEGVRTPVTVIPPGFDWPALHNEAMRPLPLHIHAWAASADNVPLIVQVGMLRPEKGHEFMLRVL
ncbi:glycosyltransferase family 1 protein, partial [Escherichia coli]|nr:glycosyltransferase family 1 protein [Escherichia coli]